MELVLKIDTKGPGIGQIIVLIGHALLGRRFDRSFPQVSPIPEMIYLFLFIGGLRQPVVDLF